MSALAKQIGAEYINLRELDEFLYDTPDVRIRLIEAIRKVKAELVFTHYQEDYNLDHVTVNHLVRQCAMHSCLPVLPTESAPLAEHPAVFQVEPFGPIHFPASHYVDISQFQKYKVELLLNHRSQEEAMQQALNEGLEKMAVTVAAFRGAQVGCAYAECFVPMAARGAVKPYAVLP
jgi:LmbE family N-acetylglucosaminyl deacetylase